MKNWCVHICGTKCIELLVAMKAHFSIMMGTHLWHNIHRFIGCDEGAFSNHIHEKFKIIFKQNLYSDIHILWCSKYGYIWGLVPQGTACSKSAHKKKQYSGYRRLCQSGWASPRDDSDKKFGRAWPIWVLFSDLPPIYSSCHFCGKSIQWNVAIGIQKSVCSIEILK